MKRHPIEHIIKRLILWFSSWTKWKFQQDNTPTHPSKSTKEWLKEKRLMFTLVKLKS